jgi:hypothetical protein
MTNVSAEKSRGLSPSGRSHFTFVVSAAAPAAEPCQCQVTVDSMCAIAGVHDLIIKQPRAFSRIRQAHDASAVATAQPRYESAAEKPW